MRAPTADLLYGLYGCTLHVVVRVALHALGRQLKFDPFKLHAFSGFHEKRTYDICVPVVVWPIVDHEDKNGKVHGRRIFAQENCCFLRVLVSALSKKDLYWLEWTMEGTTARSPEVYIYGYNDVHS